MFLLEISYSYHNPNDGKFTFLPKNLYLIYKTTNVLYLSLWSSSYTNCVWRGRVFSIGRELRVTKTAENVQYPGLLSCSCSKLHWQRHSVSHRTKSPEQLWLQNFKQLMFYILIPCHLRITIRSVRVKLFPAGRRKLYARVAYVLYLVLLSLLCNKFSRKKKVVPLDERSCDCIMLSICSYPNLSLYYSRHQSYYFRNGRTSSIPQSTVKALDHLHNVVGIYIYQSFLFREWCSFVSS